MSINEMESKARELRQLQSLIEEAQAEAEAKVEDVPQMPSNNTPEVSSQISPLEDVNKQWISFKALLSTEDALALKKFFDDRNIIFEKI